MHKFASIPRRYAFATRDARAKPPTLQARVPRNGPFWLQSSRPNAKNMRAVLRHDPSASRTHSCFTAKARLSLLGKCPRTCKWTWMILMDQTSHRTKPTSQLGHLDLFGLRRTHRSRIHAQEPPIRRGRDNLSRVRRGLMPGSSNTVREHKTRQEGWQVRLSGQRAHPSLRR